MYNYLKKAFVFSSLIAGTWAVDCATDTTDQTCPSVAEFQAAVDLAWATKDYVITGSGSTTVNLIPVELQFSEYQEYSTVQTRYLNRLKTKAAFTTVAELDTYTIATSNKEATFVAQTSVTPEACATTDKHGDHLFLFNSVESTPVCNDDFDGFTCRIGIDSLSSSWGGMYVHAYLDENSNFQLKGLEIGVSINTLIPDGYEGLVGDASIGLLIPLEVEETTADVFDEEASALTTPCSSNVAEVIAGIGNHEPTTTPTTSPAPSLQAPAILSFVFALVVLLQ